MIYFVVYQTDTDYSIFDIETAMNLMQSDLKGRFTEWMELSLIGELK